MAFRVCDHCGGLLLMASQFFFWCEKCPSLTQPCQRCRMLENAALIDTSLLFDDSNGESVMEWLRR